MAFRRLGGSTLTGKKYNSTSVDAAYVAPTGGTITTSGNFRIHSFTADGTFALVGSTKASGYRYYKDSGLPVDYLVVAGGGAGGGNNSGGQNGGGGGGGGGYRCTITATGGGGALESTLKIIKTTTVTVGPGGAGAQTFGGNGGNSGADSSICAVGAFFSNSACNALCCATP